MDNIRKLFADDQYQMPPSGRRVPSLMGGTQQNPSADPTNQDSVAAQLTPGEFVVNKEAASQYGDVLAKMNEEGLGQRAQGVQQTQQGGGNWLMSSAQAGTLDGSETPTYGEKINKSRQDHRDSGFWNTGIGSFFGDRRHGAENFEVSPSLLTEDRDISPDTEKGSYAPKDRYIYQIISQYKDAVRKKEMSPGDAIRGISKRLGISLDRAGLAMDESKLFIDPITKESVSFIEIEDTYATIRSIADHHTRQTGDASEGANLASRELGITIEDVQTAMDAENGQVAPYGGSAMPPRGQEEEQPVAPPESMPDRGPGSGRGYGQGGVPPVAQDIPITPETPVDAPQGSSAYERPVPAPVDAPQGSSAYERPVPAPVVDESYEGLDTVGSDRPRGISNNYAPHQRPVVNEQTGTEAGPAPDQEGPNEDGSITLAGKQYNAGDTLEVGDLSFEVGEDGELTPLDEPSNEAYEGILGKIDEVFSKDKSFLGFTGQDFGRLAMMYLGARLSGGEHGQSMAWAAKASLSMAAEAQKNDAAVAKAQIDRQDKREARASTSSDLAAGHASAELIAGRQIVHEQIGASRLSRTNAIAAHRAAVNKRNDLKVAGGTAQELASLNGHIAELASERDSIEEQLLSQLNHREAMEQEALKGNDAIRLQQTKDGGGTPESRLDFTSDVGVVRIPTGGGQTRAYNTMFSNTTKQNMYKKDGVWTPVPDGATIYDQQSMKSITAGFEKVITSRIGVIEGADDSAIGSAALAQQVGAMYVNAMSTFNNPDPQALKLAYNEALLRYTNEFTAWDEHKNGAKPNIEGYILDDTFQLATGVEQTDIIGTEEHNLVGLDNDVVRADVSWKDVRAVYEKVKRGLGNDYKPTSDKKGQYNEFTWFTHLALRANPDPQTRKLFDSALKQVKKDKPNNG